MNEFIAEIFKKRSEFILNDSRRRKPTKIHMGREEVIKLNQLPRDEFLSIGHIDFYCVDFYCGMSMYALGMEVVEEPEENTLWVE